MTSPDEGRPANAGFTLVELLVVLAIIAVAVGLVMPVLGNALRRAGLQGAQGEICAALRAAGSAAIAEGRISVFRGDPAGGGYWVDRRFHRLASSGPVRIAVAGPGQVSFYPWGGSSGGQVWIEGGGQGRQGIAVDAVTGRALPYP